MFLCRITPDDSALALGRWELGDAPLIVGRDEGATVRIPDYRMSGRHFIIVREGGAFFLHDLNSKNGTWINGLRVMRRELKPGDRIAAGRIFFSLDAPPMAVIRQLKKEETRNVPALFSQL